LFFAGDIIFRQKVKLKIKNSKNKVLACSLSPCLLLSGVFLLTGDISPKREIKN
jgi:hypothetical protein